MADDENRLPKGGHASLFGWEPMYWKSRGRPPHVRTENNANKVKRLLAFGKSDAQIANALGISLPTFRKYYFSELKVRAMTRDALDARVIDLLWEQFEAGNVGAGKQLQAKLDRADMQRRAKEATGDDDESQMPERRIAALGKKEQAAEDAAAALRDSPLFDPMRLN